MVMSDPTAPLSPDEREILRRAYNSMSVVLRRAQERLQRPGLAPRTVQIDIDDFTRHLHTAGQVITSHDRPSTMSLDADETLSRWQAAVTALTRHMDTATGAPATELAGAADIIERVVTAALDLHWIATSAGSTNWQYFRVDVPHEEP